MSSPVVEWRNEGSMVVSSRTARVGHGHALVRKHLEGTPVKHLEGTPVVEWLNEGLIRENKMCRSARFDECVAWVSLGFM
eukprot:1792053-Pyramimonas_sp.AAC.1